MSDTNLGWNMPPLNFESLPVNPAALQSPISITKGPMGFMDYMSDAGDWMSKTFGQGGGFGGKIVNGDKLQGWGMPAVGALSGLAQGYLGYQTLGLARDSFAQNKKQFEMNWGAQQKTVNSRLEDRQRARTGGSTSGYQSVSDYMNKNGI